MEKTISQVLEYFQHIVRDILIYLTSGLLVIGDILWLNNEIDNQWLFNIIESTPNLWLYTILISYIIGHFIIGFMYLVVEKTRLEKLISKIIMGIDPELDLKGEIEIFIKNRTLYDYFIERYNHIYYIRWNMAGAGLLIFIINTVCYLKGFSIQTLYLGLVGLISFIIFIILHYKTGMDYNVRIEIIKSNLNNQMES